jgi:hypothetical protein
MIGWVVVAVVAAVVGSKLAKRAVTAYDVKRLPKDCPSALRDCPANVLAPNPSGGDPVPGTATALGYQWCHIVRRGDSAGSIAEKIVGDRQRYLELVAANPQKGAAPVVLKDGRTEMNFRDPLCPQERLLIPKAWNPWIDQTGAPRGQKTAWPPFDILPEYSPSGLLDIGLLPTKDRGWAP